ncbi:MAG: Rieske 2Fe-2S domain-containing protein [Bryobacterales bacterium]|nr:Rieske 2Fe-2S domain-containing protein [Bryobacterales bacterium]
MAFLSRRSKRREPRYADNLRLASYPPPYPDGWYRLLSSRSLRRGQVRYLECLGRALVVWRSEDADDVFAMAAFCPHLGANLGNGRVCQDRIECPFHAWQFTGDGRAARVPYSDSVPTRVATESFPVQEAHGQIFMYHRGGEAKQQAGEEVPYPVPRIREVDDGSFAFRGHYDAGRIHMHMIELIENAADPAHFTYLHSRMNVPWTQIPIPGVELEHSARLDFDDNREPCRMPVLLETVLKVFGHRIERTRARTRVTYTGAGSILNIRITIPNSGDVEIIQTHLPTAPLEQQVDFCWFADRRVPRILVWYAIGNWISQWRNDVRIWEDKVFMGPPTLCRDDGPVMRLRGWYKQFFPDPVTDRDSPAARSGSN